MALQRQRSSSLAMCRREAPLSALRGATNSLRCEKRTLSVATLSSHCLLPNVHMKAQAVPPLGYPSPKHNALHRVIPNQYCLWSQVKSSDTGSRSSLVSGWKMNICSLLPSRRKRGIFQRESSMKKCFIPSSCLFKASKPESSGQSDTGRYHCPKLLTEMGDLGSG